LEQKAANLDVSVHGNNSKLYELLLGTVQSTLIEPMLFDIFVAPLFDLEMLLAFADDIFIPRTGKDVVHLIQDLETSMENIAKWIKDSGLKLNGTKTEICMFNRSDLTPVAVVVGGARIVSSDYMNVLDVIFDT
jgi:hypothetical protein